MRIREREEIVLCCIHGPKGSNFGHREFMKLFFPLLALKGDEQRNGLIFTRRPFARMYNAEENDARIVQLRTQYFRAPYSRHSLEGN